MTRIGNTTFFGLLASLIVACVLAAGCGHESTQAKPGKENQTACTALQERFDAVLKAGKAACAKNADCGCYNPVSRKAGCGGITDKKAAESLAVIEKEFHRAGCDWPLDCAAWVCIPRCVMGRCVNSR